MKDSINFNSIFEDLPNPAILVSDENTVRLNQAANDLCAELRQALRPELKDCEGFSITTILGDDLISFRESGEDKKTIQRIIESTDGNRHFDIILKKFRMPDEIILIQLVDITENQKMKTAMSELAKGVLSSVGDEFFESLVTHLVKASGADHAFICEFTDEAKTKVQTVAVCVDGEIGENISFELETTPCNLVVRKGAQYFESHVMDDFPLDHLAKEMGVDSYFGIPLIDSKGEVLGPMAVMGRKPLNNSTFAVSMLKLFAVRASAELERRHNEKELKNNINFLQSLLNAIPSPIFYKNTNGLYLGCNKSLEDCVGKDKYEIVGRHVNQLAPRDWAATCDRTDKELIETGTLRPYESTVVFADGSERDVIFSKAVFSDSDDNIAGIIGIITDITARRQAEQKIEKLAYYDVLTDLPNRQLLKERLSLLIEHSIRNSENFALLFIDLDRFKNINDTLGHSIGDDLLKHVSKLLKDQVRSCDTVARLGGDEFVVILTNIRDMNVSKISEKLLKSMSKPMFVKGHEIFTSLSIGISVFPNDGYDPETLLKNADVAMYQAKDLGRNNFQFYSKEMNRKAVERLKMENNLRHALERDEFFLAYQPQFDIKNNCFFGVEALIRWDQPDEGVIPPGNFIKLAEETGLILPIGEWVMKQAFIQNALWEREAGIKITTAVNISPLQFKQDDFAENVENIVKETGVNPHNIEFELTESLLIESGSKTNDTLIKLKELGLQISIDDFGTGYSSLSYLKHLPIDRVKIDRSFIKDVAEDSDNTAITKAIIAISESLKLKVIAEGVEDEQQLDILKELGCHEAQGFLFGRPELPERIVPKLTICRY